MAAYCVPTEPPKPFTAEAGGLTGSVVVGPDGVPVREDDTGDTGDNTDSGKEVPGPIFVGAEPELPVNHDGGPASGSHSGSPDDSNGDNGAGPNMINTNPTVDPTVNPAQPTDDPDSTINTGDGGTIDPIEVDPNIDGGTIDNSTIVPIDTVDPTITVDPDTTDEGGIAGTAGEGTIDPTNPVTESFDLEDVITPSGGDKPAEPPESPEPAPQPTPAPEPAPEPNQGPDWTPEIPMGPFVD